MVVSAWVSKHGCLEHLDLPEVDGIKAVINNATITLQFAHNNIIFSSDVQANIQFQKREIHVFGDMDADDDGIVSLYTHSEKDAYVELKEKVYSFYVILENGINVKISLSSNGITVEPTKGSKITFSNLSTYGFTITAV